MNEQRQRLTYNGNSVVLLIVLITAGFVGNYFSLRLFTGFDYLFGSISVLLVVRLFGVRWGLLAGVVASSWTITLFGHPYAMIWLCGEPLFIGWLLAKGRTRNILLYDTLYWPFLGAPLIWCFFQYVMHVSFAGTVAAMLVYWLIGICNALIASLLLAYVPRLATAGAPEINRSIPIQQLIFNLLMAIVVIPVIVILILNGKDTEQRYLYEMYDNLEDSSRIALYEIKLKLQKQSVAIAVPFTARGVLQGYAAAGIRVDVLKDLLLNARVRQYQQITLVDGTGKVITSTNSALSPLDFFDICKNGAMSRVTPKNIYRCFPSPNSPMPLWQRAQKSNYILYAPMLDATSWNVVVETPFAPYQQQLFKEHIKSLLVALCLNMIALATSLTTSRRLAAPLRRLSQVTTDLPQRLLHENINIWPESMVTEIDQLIGNFRVMATALSQKFQEITYANETLELHVDERTKELVGANEELQKEIAERKQAEAERNHLMLELKQKNKELEGIIYVASHDLRSPLVNVQGFSRKLVKNCAELDRILSKLDLDVATRTLLEPILKGNIPKSLGFITGSIEKIDGLLSALLRLSRLGRAALCFDNLDMQNILSKIVDSMTYQIEACGARIELGTLGTCFADREQVIQVFSNLLDNAIKYRSPERPLLVRVFREEFAEGVRYCVEDNGIGIPHDHQEKIWEIFQRLNPGDSEGDGLGLTLVRRIIDRLGGSIWVESEPGLGSRFYVVFLKQHEVK